MWKRVTVVEGFQRRRRVGSVIVVGHVHALDLVLDLVSGARVIAPIASKLRKYASLRDIGFAPRYRDVATLYTRSSLLRPISAMEGTASTERPAMFTPEHYRAKAAEYGQLAKIAPDTGQAREFQRRERSFTMLADNEQWLADHYGQTVHAADAGVVDDATPALIGGAAAQ